jgi:hypothetical protein
MTRFLSLHRVGLLAALLLVGIATTLHAQTIATFDLPNSISTQPAAINQAGQITGSYVDAVGQHGFLRQADGTLISFDAPLTFPLGGPTAVTSMNSSGQIVGYIYSSDVFLDYGFLRQPDGTFKVFGGDCFLGPASASVSLPFQEGITPTAINDRGQIVGECGPGIAIDFGFLRQPDGTITVFEPRPALNPPSTQAIGINSRGQVTGVYLDGSTFSYRGFLREPDGIITAFDASSSGTKPTAINSRSQITGNSGNDGFLRQPDGSIELFYGPNSTSTQPTAINRKGQIVGSYLDTGGANHGFLRKKNGSIVTLDVPNATNTNPTGINARGEITGWYSDASGVHGFVRSRNHDRTAE